MQRNEQLRQQQVGSPASRNMNESDAVTDSMLKNISVMATHKIAPNHSRGKDLHQIQQTIASECGQQGNNGLAAVDDFADFEYFTKQNVVHPAFTNGCSNPFDDFDNFVTSNSPVLHAQISNSHSDKYDAFRELHSSSKESSEAPAVPEDRISIWMRCLVACKQLLQKSFNALIVSHGEDSAVEALQSQAGHAFIRDLHQIYLMTQRIGTAYRSMCLRSDELSNLLTDVAMTWRPLHLLFNKVTHMPESNTNCYPEAKSGSCLICLCASPPDVVPVKANPFHSVCANLWIHCISPHLPDPK